TVLLDVDGTLINSNLYHAKAWSQAFADFGLSVSTEKIFPYIGMGGEKLIRALLPDIDEKKSRQLGDRHSEIFLKDYACDVTATPGAHELVIGLRDRNLEPVVATSAHKDELKVVLGAAGLDELFDSAITADDVERSKPDPDLVSEALEKTQTAPNDAVMIGDTPYDIEAAHQARVATVALLCGGRSAEDLRAAEAIYRDPASLLEHLDHICNLRLEH
ncbi:MAG: HAD family hydrolase, partial [Candidatus Eremiobacteraeota bacterium]|nr:HAD family hydrolase [Candidatus Eremiobacteraeota bacterium]